MNFKQLKITLAACAFLNAFFLIDIVRGQNMILLLNSMPWFIVEMITIFCLIEVDAKRGQVNEMVFDFKVNIEKPKAVYAAIIILLLVGCGYFVVANQQLKNANHAIAGGWRDQSAELINVCEIDYNSYLEDQRERVIREALGCEAGVPCPGKIGGIFK